MAKQKATSKAAAKTAVKKKWTGLGTAAKTSARKTIKSKGRRADGEIEGGSQASEGSKTEGAAETAHRHQPSP